ncbi:hypothetical protein GQ53DRAFT_262430 [Thozetella sp. PMI_491]|nr:hypothetical protein GQ53DRAFT_262430 [Thozetella sp. PMI_491]
MHFAYPPRKSSNPTAYIPRSTKLPTLRRNRIRVIALGALAFFFLFYLLTRPSSHHAAVTRTPSGKPPVVLVTVFDNKASESYIQSIKENRIQYANKHGYETFFANVGDYKLGGSPGSWTKVPAMRHAITKFPDCKYLWYLDQDAFVMSPSVTLEDYLMKASTLESLMIKDHPVVPPDSIIKTFTHLKGQDVDFVLTQDNDGLSVGSFVLRNGDWAKFFLETWYDPIYRSYNFQKAETHALEHIVQWHPTILSKLALVPQNIINAYSQPAKGVAYKDGDIAVRFPECSKSKSDDCVVQSQRFEQTWRASFKNS